MIFGRQLARKINDMFQSDPGLSGEIAINVKAYNLNFRASIYHVSIRLVYRQWPPPRVI